MIFQIDRLTQADCNSKHRQPAVLTPEDIADVVSFLCGDASRYVTETIILVDGGRAIVY